MHPFARPLAALVLLGLSLPAAAEPPAPFVAPLEGLRIELELSNLTLDIEVRAGAEPSLSARPLAEGVVPGDALVVTTSQGTVTVSRLDQPASRTHDMALQVTLDPSQSLSIRGHDLDVDLTETGSLDEEPMVTAVPLMPDTDAQPADTDTIKDQPEPAARHSRGTLSLVIDVADSDVRMSGIDGASITVEGGSLAATDCQGRFVLTSTRGLVEIHNHEGALSLVGHDAELTVSEGRGQIELKLEGGAFFGRSGHGSVSGRAVDGRVQLESWRGASSLSGSGTTIEIRRSVGVRVITSGDDLDVTVEGWHGALTARLRGGSLRGSGWNGAAEVTGREGTLVDLAELHGELTLNLSHGSTGTLSGIHGQLTTKITDSALDAEDVHIITVLARQSRVNLSGATKINTLTVIDSELDADLTRLRGKATITLNGASRGRFQLTQPCMVRTTGRGARQGDSATVSGCDQRRPRQRKGRHGRSLGGDRPVELKLFLSTDAEAHVTGYP